MNILIPLNNKSASKDYNDNFLFQIENVYLMDNHRLALWCWFQEINLIERYNLLHIDAHPDLSDSALEDFDSLKNQMKNLKLKEYRETIQLKYNVPLFRWDNYMKIFTEKFAENYLSETSMSFTHHLGSNEKLTRDLSSIYLLKELDEIFTQKKFVNENAWIVNLDLDYFFSSLPHKKMIFNEEFIESIGEFLKSGLANKMIKVLTIAFSPECCGSWENAEMVFKVLNKKLKLKIND